MIEIYYDYGRHVWRWKVHQWRRDHFTGTALHSWFMGCGTPNYGVTPKQALLKAKQFIIDYFTPSKKTKTRGKSNNA